MKRDLCKSNENGCRHRRMRYIMFVLCIAALLLCLLSGCRKADEEQITSYDQLSEPGTKLGVELDCPEYPLVVERYPDAEIVPYNDMQMAYADVQTGRIKALVYARKTMEIAIKGGTEGVVLLDETFCSNKIAVGLSPKSQIPDIEDKINTFIAELKADGTLDDMYDRWVDKGDETMPDIPVPENPTVHLRVATAGVAPPYTYYKGTELNGYDIELAKRFAAWLNADLEFKVIDYGAIIAAAKTGDVDCIMANLYYTPEHAKSIPFSDILFEIEITAMVRDVSAETQGGFFATVKEKFCRTFIEEDRWKLFAAGLSTTVLIVVLSILIGTLLGYAVFMMCRNGHSAANKITNFCIWLVQGMPAVVLLMILYYIVFGSFVITGTVVSVVAFTLLFGSSVFSNFRASVAAIDSGQLEAAYALGFTNRRAFLRVILPQAMPYFLPKYKEDIVAIIKATAVVGYVAVQDLTKMGDVVRSSTYEAFFPLIAVAVMYFVLAAVLKRIVKKLEIRVDPKQRTIEQIKKEVEGL